MFLLWPLLLAIVMVSLLDEPAQRAGLSDDRRARCLTTATIALFCSVMFRKTSSSLMTTYLVIVTLFTLPLAISFFANTFFEGTN